MKLLSFCKLNVHLRQIGYSVRKNGNLCSSSGILKHLRSIPSGEYTAKSRHYQYNVDELQKNLNLLPGKDELSQNLLNFRQLFNTKEIFDFDVQEIVNFVILGAKCDVGYSFKNDNFFNEFLNRLNSSIENMTADNIVSSLIALNLLNVPLYHPVNRNLMVKLMHMLRDSKEFALVPLTNLAIYARENCEKLFPYYVCADANSHILGHLNKCESVQSLYHITLFYLSLPGLHNRTIMSMHKTKMKILLEDIDVKANIKELLEILRFYNHNAHNKNSRMIRNILLKMAPELSSFSNDELRQCALFQNKIHEPASLVPAIVNEAESRPDKSTDLNLIYCRLAKKTPDSRQNLHDDLKKIIKDLNAKDIIQNYTLYLVLNTKRDRDMKEIDLYYWNKVTYDLARLNSLCLLNATTLMELTSRYMVMQKRSNFMWRCQTFEKMLRKLVLSEIEYGISALSPSRLAFFSQFIIGCANDPVTNIITLPEHFVKKVEEMAPQFSVREIADLSFGIESFHQNGFSKKMNRSLAASIADRIRRLENIIDEQIERRLEEGPAGASITADDQYILSNRKHLRIDGTCTLIRAYANQKALKQTHILEKLTRKLEEICSSNGIIITARNIQRITNSLNKIVFIVPKLCERMLMFVNENIDIVDGETVSHLLYYLFSMGYEPYIDSYQNLLNSGNIDECKRQFLDAELFCFNNFNRIIDRDFEFIPAGLIVKACLALSFYEALSLDLINRVFNIDFISRLEKELALSYNMDGYSKNILNLVMQLNRSICLSYPEALVPWFQQSFIEAQLAANPPRFGPYMNEIYKMLLAYVGDDASMIRTNHNTPYGYRIPFVIYFNSEKQLVAPPFDEGPQTLNKVAIIPLFDSPSHFNAKKNSRGFDRLQERHLNILGYYVVQIGYRDWNSIHMNLPGAREEYLRNCLNRYKFLTK